MARFIHSVLVPNQSISVATVTTFDMPVNPLSHINIVLKCLEAGATAPTLLNMLATISQVEVLFKGSAIMSMSGIDLYATSRFLLGHPPWENNLATLDNQIRWLSIPMMFGRTQYSPQECFPASQRGSLQLRITWAASFTALDALTLLVETVELPEASPEQFMKITTLTQTAVVGQNDLELPIGNAVHGLVLFGTTVPAGTTDTVTINDLAILADNTQIYYTSAFFEGIQAQHQQHVAPYLRPVVAAAGLAQDIPSHLYLPFDVLGDGQYIMDTEGLASFILRYTGGDTNAVRVLPMEILKVSA